MAAQEENPLENHCRQTEYPKAYQESSSKCTTQWNRAIPETSYITLGTIRYGVRLSNCVPSSVSLKGSTKTLPVTMRNEQNKCSTSTLAEGLNGDTYDVISQRTNISTENSSCCCIGSTGLSLPWHTNEYHRANPSINPSEVKNRNVSTSHLPSFSLVAMSAPPLQPQPSSTPIELVETTNKISGETVVTTTTTTTVFSLYSNTKLSTTFPSDTAVLITSSVNQASFSKTEKQIVPSNHAKLLTNTIIETAIQGASNFISSAATTISSTSVSSSTSTQKDLNSSIAFSNGIRNCCELNTAPLVSCEKSHESVLHLTPLSSSCYTITSCNHNLTNKRLTSPPTPPPKPNKRPEIGSLRKKIKQFEERQFNNINNNNRSEQSAKCHNFNCFSIGSASTDSCNSSISDRNKKCNPTNCFSRVTSTNTKSDLQQLKPSLQYFHIKNLETVGYKNDHQNNLSKRKVTPHTNRKFTQQNIERNGRNINEDRLIEKDINEKNVLLLSDNDNCIYLNCNDDSDIGYIDSSTSCDRLSSISDLDLIGFNEVTSPTITVVSKIATICCDPSNNDIIPNIISDNNNSNNVYNKLNDTQLSSVSGGDSSCSCSTNNSNNNLNFNESDQFYSQHRKINSFQSFINSEGDFVQIYSNGLQAHKFCNLCCDYYNFNFSSKLKKCSKNVSKSQSLKSDKTFSEQVNFKLLRGPYLSRSQSTEESPIGYLSRSLPHVRPSSEKELMMEKRRNTLDRLQRLGFGRRSSPNSSTQQDSKSVAKKSSEKSEKLRELTELLKGNRTPPIPPPRKPRQHGINDKISISTEGLLCQAELDDIIPMDKEEQIIPERLKRRSDEISNRNCKSVSVSGTPTSSHKGSLQNIYRPHTSVSDLISLCPKTENEDPIVAPISNTVSLKEDEIFAKLQRPESRTIIGSYTQKTIPFRSASFSQIDYSSGKYIKSAIGAFRDKLKKDKEQSVVENANLTLPRKKNDTKELSLKDEKDNSSHIIDTKKTELCINLRYDQENEKVSLEEKVRPPDVIPEEELGLEHFDISSSQLMEEKLELNNKDFLESMQKSSHPISITETIEPSLASLIEENIPLESPPENFLQTATTCLIPVPVYECIAKAWSRQHSAEQWTDGDIINTEISPEVLGSSEEIITEVKKENEIKDNQIGIEPVPIISVSQHSLVVSQFNEYPEVKKRYSHDECRNVDKNSPIDTSANKDPVVEEKRKMDKSRRRKGMYIQWPVIEKHIGISSPEWAAPVNDNDTEETKAVFDLSNVQPLLTSQCSLNENNQLSNSRYSYDPPTTPDSDSSRPVWPKVAKRPSFAYQSSEEKDDSLFVQLINQQPLKALAFMHSESISDTESDKNLSSRERTSPSPAPCEQDPKRYSKRPLRGPYGQMLEAEMKKPVKMHFDEILEEFKNSDSLNTLSPPVRIRSIGNHSFDETNLTNHLSKSLRLRKVNAQLPIPMHTRAASTPSQMENTNTEHSYNTISVSHHKRCPSETTDPKKLSSHYIRECSPPKRASSEATDQKSHPKRSSSTTSDKSQKRSLDDIRLSQVSRTPSERSMIMGSSDSGKANLVPTPELLAELLKGSSERLISEQRQQMFTDTRTHVVQEIFRNEQSYVESLETVVVKYLNVLKTPEYAGMIDSKTVDEIFFMVPDILNIHEKFLNEMKARLDAWDSQQKVGDIFIETFSKTEVLDTYTSFVNNCNRAKDAIRMTSQARPSFARFLEAMSREHKGKLTLDNLLIKPVQKFPNYEMLFTRLIKHTDVDHPDQKPLQEVLKLVHDILVHINCKEKEVLVNGQREATLRELENVIEGITELVIPERQFIMFDQVTMPSGQGARKERGFFLFSDLLVISSIKRRSGTIRKPNTTICPGSIASTLDTNKYKFLTKIFLDQLEIVKTKDENLRRIMSEIEQLSEDCIKLQQMAEITATLRCPHQCLEDTIRELHRDVQRQLNERQSNDTQLSLLELTVNSPNGIQNLSIDLGSPEKRSRWEEAFIDAKQKIVASLDKQPIPEFLTSIPIRKTRAGLQFTCAAPTLSSQKDVWVCNSDGYVGQVCVLSLTPEPTVTSCNGVCNARILCLASVPGINQINENRITTTSAEDLTKKIENHRNSEIVEQKRSSNLLQNRSDMQLDSNSSSEDSEPENTNLERIPSSIISTQQQGQHSHQDSNVEETDIQQPTMWLGTEDGCIHVYNCTDNIRIKKNKIKIQHINAVYSILYLDNRVFVSLANGDICVYLRENGGWNTTSPHCIPLGTVTSPVNRLINVLGKLWCSIQGIIKVLDTKSLQVENQIQISSDSKPITNMAAAGNCVWISIQNSAHIKCFHSNSYELIFEVNLAPAVNKMLSNCDDIIRQHKAACLRVTSLLSCKDLIWIGTSAGVLLTIPAQSYNKGQIGTTPIVTGLPHGHTGHVRFLTSVEIQRNPKNISSDLDNLNSVDNKNKRNSAQSNTKTDTPAILVISGGDGYEDFRTTGVNTVSEVAGREDSTNHLLLWQM